MALPSKRRSAVASKSKIGEVLDSAAVASFAAVRDHQTIGDHVDSFSGYFVR